MDHDDDDDDCVMLRYVKNIFKQATRSKINRIKLEQQQINL